MIKHSLELKPKLNLSLLLGNHIQLLECTSLELEQEIEKEQDINPYIVLQTKKPTKWFHWDEPKSFEVASSPSEIQDLVYQARLELSGKEFEIAQELLYSVDHRGYLRIGVEELAKALGVKPQEVERVRRFLMKNLEPIGVCSINVEEFILLQLEELYPDNRDLQKRVIRAIKEGKVDKELRDVLVRLRLSPLSGDVVYKSATVDVVLEHANGEWYVILYDDFVDVEVKEDEVKDSSDMDKLRRARSLKLLMEIRRRNLRRIVEIIVDTQKDFLLGKKPLKSLTLSQVANQLGVGLSTVSRLVNRKYVKTPLGVYPLRSFFVRSSKHGLSTEEVLRLIKEALKDLGNGATDKQISQYLKKMGLDIARRTINKYRRLI